MRQFLRITFLTGIWVLLWGRASVANIASGVVVAALLLVLYPTQPMATTSVGRPRPVAVAKLIASILGEMAVSNAYIAREIVTRGSNIRTGIVACRLRTDSERTITFLANVLSLSPGTMPVHVQADPAVIYVHVLHLFDANDVRRRIARLEALAVKAFGSAAAIEALGAEVHHRGAGVELTEVAISDDAPADTPADPRDRGGS